MANGMRAEHWRNRAACQGLPSEWFFPERGGEKSYEQGKEVCRMCTVRRPCLELANDFVSSGDRYGLFGGLTPQERKIQRCEDIKVIHLIK